MASEKKKLPVIPNPNPKAKEHGEPEPEFVHPRSGKYNWKVDSEGADWVIQPLDEQGMPLIVVPKRKRKDK